jgi:glycosyltransferase involved in cell wall biosynthesis
MEQKSSQKIEGSKGIMILTPFFSPNLGGVETHLDDLVSGLDSSNCRVYVQTYSPITTANTSWRSREKRGRNIEIRRYRWFGKNIFHKIERFPFFDFLYLTPYLFLRTFFWLILNSKKINVIHAQGFNAAWMGVIFKKIFKNKLIVSTHAIYEIEKKSKTAERIVKILNKTDKVLALSRRSYDELVSFGLREKKLDQFKYWINLDIFMAIDKKIIRKDLNINDKFTVLFVGRLIEKKGIKILIEVAKLLRNINFIFIGAGPEALFLKAMERKLNNVKFLGAVRNYDLSKYYSSADIFCIPSQYEEGFGRVVMEAVACGLPVVGSNKGGIPEALDDSVSILVDPTAENLRKPIEELYENQEKYSELKNNCRKYAEENFSEKNLKLITKYY